jgi:hypothetical protein
MKIYVAEYDEILLSIKVMKLAGLANAPSSPFLEKNVGYCGLCTSTVVWQTLILVKF